MKKTWCVLNGLLKPGQSSMKTVVDSLLLDGDIFENPIDISNIMNNHFASIGRKIAESFQTSNHTDVSETVLNRSFFFKPVSSNDMSKAILELKNKSCNINIIPNRVLKHIEHLISPVISQL